MSRKDQSWPRVQQRCSCVQKSVLAEFVPRNRRNCGGAVEQEIPNEEQFGSLAKWDVVVIHVHEEIVSIAVLFKGTDCDGEF